LQGRTTIRQEGEGHGWYRFFVEGYAGPWQRDGGGAQGSKKGSPRGDA